jgi:hypothetical protein
VVDLFLAPAGKAGSENAPSAIGFRLPRKQAFSLSLTSLLHGVSELWEFGMVGLPGGHASLEGKN